jgi:oligopeptide/dipeptide ABC transporter ATP-binding protein
MEPILQVDNLRVHFKTQNGIVKAVDGLNFTLHKGETLAIVGESGSGKSVSNLALMGLLGHSKAIVRTGQARYAGQDLLSLPESQLQQIRGDRIAMIFQDPMTSLNPFLRISTQMIEILMLHKKLSKKQAKERSLEMLKLVGIHDAESKIDAYPHQFSGGMRQRVMIAMALLCEPDILIADEPTSALDVTVQAQIIQLIQELSHRFGTAVIMITHDLGIVAGSADRVLVMYAGRIAEQGTVDQIFYHPQHPYTQGLLSSIPRIDAPRDQRLRCIDGQPPTIINMPDSCPFWQRCSQHQPRCKNEYPPISTSHDHHQVACWLYGENK